MRRQRSNLLLLEINALLHPSAIGDVQAWRCADRPQPSAIGDGRSRGGRADPPQPPPHRRCRVKKRNHDDSARILANLPLLETGGVEEGVHGRFGYGGLERNFLGAAARAADWSGVDGGEGVDGRFGDGELERTFLGAAARAADWSGGDGGISEAGAQRARALMAGSEFPFLEQPRGRRTGAAGMAGSARRGRRERGRERERAAGRTVHQKSVYVYTMVLYSSRD
jgi:hypothetical protein